MLKWVVLTVVVLGAAAAAVFATPLRDTLFGPSDYQACAARYGAVAESYPSRCETPEGEVFTDATPGTPPPFVLFSGINPAEPIVPPLVLRGAVPAGSALPVATLYEAGQAIASTTLTAGATEGGYTKVGGTLEFAAAGDDGSGELVLTSATMQRPVRIPVLLFPN